MRTATASVILPCTPEAFWSVYLDDAYQRALYLDELRYKELSVLERTDDGRKLRIVPKLSLPGPLARLIGDSFAYELHGVLDRAKNVWTWRMEQPGGSKKKGIVSTRGTLRIEAVDGQCRRSDECIIEGNVFGIGGLIEATAEKEAQAAWTTEFALLARWFARPGGAQSLGSRAGAPTP